MAFNDIIRATLLTVGPPVALTVALSCTVAMPCFAQAPEVSASDKETARQLMDSGDEKFERGDYAGALKDYQGADSIMGVSSTGYAVGRTLAQLGRLIEARDKLLTVMRMPPVDGESPILLKARVEANRLQSEVADRIPSLKLQITGVPDDADVTIRIGGQPVPAQTMALPRTVDPGTHEIDGSCPGYEKVTLKITVTEGEQRQVEVVFKRAQQGADGTAEDDGISPLVIAGFSVGGVGIIIGAITGGVSLAQASDVKDQCTNDVCPTALEEDRDSSVTLAHVSTASFIIGGSGVALGVIGLILDSQGNSADVEADSASLQVEPLIGFGSLGLRGRF